jgi:hypothetical protein
MIACTEDIQVRNNLTLTIRERGKIVARREGHNIFLNYGREWLSKLIGYKSFSPDVVETDARVRYMGLGIGGTRQIAPATADAAPLSDYGPVGSFTQTDTDPTISQLERPVRVSGGAGGPAPTDSWLAQVQPSTHDTPTSVTFRRLFTAADISYGGYLSVPVSEIGLFLSDCPTNFRNNYCVAYDTFDTLSKTAAFELEAVWVLRIG